MTSALHSELCILACRWLKQHAHAKHAFAEFQSMSLQEFPDAIGFPAAARRGPTVIEVKVSVEDFKRDKNKSWRRCEKIGMEHSCGMGAHRYYLVPEGLIHVDDVPEDHGLLVAETRRGRLHIPKKPAREAPVRSKRDVASELSVLGTALRRWELGIPWIADEFRFESERETRMRTSPEQRRGVARQGAA